MWKAIGVAAILLLGAVLAAVIWLRPPQDLTVESVQVVRWSQMTAADGPASPAEPDKLLAVVRFATAGDLAALGHDFWYRGLYARASLCGSGKTISEGFNLVFGRSGRISFGDRHPGGAGPPDYHVYVALQSSDIAGFSRYDLVKSPEDICLRLEPDAPEYGHGPSTNVMRIPRAALLAALRQGRR